MPRMSSCNGVTDGTKMTTNEHVGNMFMLLCAIHTIDGHDILREGLGAEGISLSAITDYMKLQLSFKKWVDDRNPIIDVCGESNLFSKFFVQIQKCFPRIDGSG